MILLLATMFTAAVSRAQDSLPPGTRIVPPSPPRPAAGPATRTPPIVQPSFEIVATRRVPAGELRGALVVPGARFAGFRQSEVLFVSDSNGEAPVWESREELDARGGFRLTVPRLREGRQLGLIVNASGWIAPAMHHLHLSPDSGYAVVIHLQPQPPGPPPPRRVVASSMYPTRTDSVPAGELHGVVVNEETGSPIGGVVVEVDRQAATWFDPRTGVGGNISGGRVMAVLTDSLGRFTLRAPADVPLAISARLVGLSTQEFHLTMSATNGFIARFALHTVPLAVCSDDFGAGGVVQVIPLDVATGVSPTQGATLVASHSGHLDSEMAVPRPVDSLARLIQPERDWLHRDATIDLMVQSPGYRTWRLTSDPPPPGPCGGPGPRFLLAWLLPIN